MFLGVLQVVGGVMLKTFIGNDFGLIKEGISDIIYGFEYLIGEEHFSWKIYGEKKKAFLINLAINLVVSYFTGNLISTTNNSDGNFKDLLVETGKHAVKKGINYVAKNMIGKDLIKKIFMKVKEYINMNSKINELIDKICKNLLENEIFDKIICMDALLDCEKNIKNFNEKLTLALNKIDKFANSLGTIIKVFKSIIDIIKSKLAEIFKTSISNISGLSESIDILVNFLSNLNGEVLGILEKHTEDFSDGINNFEDYINKKLIGKNCDDLFDILKKNNLIMNSGILNGKLLCDDGQNHIISQDFKNIWKTPENFFSNFSDDKIFDLLNNDFDFSLESINFEEYANKKDELIKILKNPIKKNEEIINKLKSFIGIDKLDFGNLGKDVLGITENIEDNLNNKFMGQILGIQGDIVNMPIDKINFGNMEKDKIIEYLKKFCIMKQQIKTELKSLIGLNNLHIESFKKVIPGNIQEKILNNPVFTQINKGPEILINKMNDITKKYGKFTNEQLKKIDKCKKYILDMGNNLSKDVKFGNLEKNYDSGLSINKINFGKYDNEKEKIIKELKNTMDRLEKFDIKKVKDEIIKKIMTKIKECFNGLLIKVLHSTEFGKHLKNISDQYEEIMNEIL